LPCSELTPPSDAEIGRALNFNMKPQKHRFLRRGFAVVARMLVQFETKPEVLGQKKLDIRRAEQSDQSGRRSPTEVPG
jgi:hypothetical protein